MMLRRGDYRVTSSEGVSWERLCVHCHDGEHSRRMLGDYLKKRDEKQKGLTDSR